MLSSSVVAAGILFFTYLTLSRTAQNAAESQARSRVENVLDVFSSAIAESLAASDKMQVHMVSRAFEKGGINAILVVSSDGDQPYATRANLDGDDIYGLPDRTQLASGGILGTSIVDGKPYLHAAKAIYFSSTPAGVLHVWLDKSDLEASILSSSAPIYGVFGLGFFLLMSLGFLSLQSPFRAIKTLDSAARTIGRGDLSKRVPVVGGDEVAGLCRTFNDMVQDLARARQATLKQQLETIHAMINTVEAKDLYTAGHCLRVGGYSLEIAGHFDELNSENIFLVETSALLHDLGKIGIPDKILLKEGRLTEEENRVIQSHVVVGESILSQIDSMKEVSTCVRHHHERWDGGGYPDGLRGTAIPFASRVIAVADAIDAMKTDRPYRKGFETTKVVEILRAERGKQFDPEIVDVAVKCLEETGDADFHRGDTHCTVDRQYSLSVV